MGCSCHCFYGALNGKLGRIFPRDVSNVGMCFVCSFSNDVCVCVFWMENQRFLKVTVE